MAQIKKAIVDAESGNAVAFATGKVQIFNMIIILKMSKIFSPAVFVRFYLYSSFAK